MPSAGVQAVVTGLGVIAGPDVGVNAFTARLHASRVAAAEVDRSQGYHAAGSSRLAVLTSGADVSSWLSAGAARRMSRPSRLAVAAARMALRDAGLDDFTGGPRTGVVMATAFGAVGSTEEILSGLRRDGPQAASPFFFAESVANAPAGQVAIDTKSQGPNVTIVQREAGCLTAMARGMSLVTTGRCDRVLVGSVDEMPPILHALLDRFGALARPGGEGGERARPFGRDRDGFIAAEGAAVLVIERADLARDRGARVRAVLRGAGSAFDPSAPRIGWGRGHAQLSRALRRTLDQSGVALADISHIVSGASGAIRGDWIEARLLVDVWRDHPVPPVVAPKATVGQYGGGFLAAAVVAAEGGAFAETTTHDPDPDLGIRPFAGGMLPPASPSLVTTCASGGAASWLLLEGTRADRSGHSGT